MKKRIVILGAGESGTGAAVLAKKYNYDVFVSDGGIIRSYYKEILDKHEIPYEEDNHTQKLILNADEIIKSPGVPDSADILKIINKKEIKVISEIEFAGRFTKAKKICITGSNGKTTTTSLIHHMMRKAGLNVGLAGNIGKSFAMQVATQEYDYYVLELSSFQLDYMYEFKADIAILLNITPDHLDRYLSMSDYVDSKFRITQNLSEEDFFIYCSDDEITINELERIVSKARHLSFSVKEKKRKGAYVQDKTMRVEFDETDFSIPLEDLALIGRHNVYNSMAASIAGNLLGLRKDFIRESLMDFKGVEHRLERFIKVHGIEFINDSKATNLNSAWYALECMATPVIWIVGGVDKGNDYADIERLVQSKVKAIVCLGKDNTKIKKSFAGKIPVIEDTHTMDEAVRTAYDLGRKGDTVLLSPACASFDLFENYEERGKQFKNTVKEL